MVRVAVVLGLIWNDEKSIAMIRNNVHFVLTDTLELNGNILLMGAS